MRAIGAIDAAPTIEPEVQHGRWINDEWHGKYRCTCCNKGVWRTFGVFDFCPNCGAKMDAKDTNVLANYEERNRMME